MKMEQSIVNTAHCETSDRSFDKKPNLIGNLSRTWSPKDYIRKTKQNPPTYVGGLCKQRLVVLHAMDVHGARSLFGLLDLKRDRVSDLELVERDIDQGGRMKKHVLILSLRGDEPETLLRQILNDSLHKIDTDKKNYLQLTSFCVKSLKLYARLRLPEYTTTNAHS